VKKYVEEMRRRNTLKKYVEERKILPAVDGFLEAVEEDRGIARLQGTKQNLYPRKNTHMKSAEGMG
jgi:hypothetical protein